MWAKEAYQSRTNPFAAERSDEPFAKKSLTTDYLLLIDVDDVWRGVDAEWAWSRVT